MQVEIGYGKTTQTCTINGHALVGIVEAHGHGCVPNGSEEVRSSLEHPIGSARLANIVTPGERIVIITSDITRPLPTHIVLPEVLRELRLSGIEPEDITVVIAVGSHRRHTDEEKSQIVGEELFSLIEVIDSSDDEFVRIGTTTRGTPVDIAKTVAKADKVICLGNVEFHYFAGFSGGYKAVMPGVSTMAAIERNHALMTHSEARAGILEGNPVREDIDEAGSMVGVDFIVNVILDESKRIIKCFSGDAMLAHREACRYLDGAFRVEVPRLVDIVIVSPGGYPKDINLYQAQKALDNAKNVVKEGGVIILSASCAEGLGQDVFEDWMRKASCPDDLLEFARKGFKLGGHKAAAIAKVLRKARVFLVSDMEPDLVCTCFFTPFESLQDAYNAAVSCCGRNASVLVMPHGSSTVPVVVE